MKFLLFVALFLFANAAIGQADLISKDRGKYIYKGETYKCKELDQALKESQKASLMYKSGKTYNTVSKYLLLGGVGLGINGTYRIMTAKFFSSTIGTNIILTGLGVIVTGIVVRIIGNNKIGSSVKIFNLERTEKYGYKSKVSLSFKETKNGLGFVLAF